MPQRQGTIDGTDFDAVVIGSGFGGSVAAIMMAKAGKHVLIIERGTWWKNPEGPSKPKKEITFTEDKTITPMNSLIALSLRQPLKKYLACL